MQPQVGAIEEVSLETVGIQCGGTGGDRLVGQFVLSKSTSEIPEGWTVRSLGDWHLGCHPELPITEIRGWGSGRIGWLLGHAVSPEGCLMHDSVQFPVSAENPDAAAHFESTLYAHGGRFAAVCVAPWGNRLYLDPAGSLAAVFCRGQNTVASSPALIRYTESSGDNHDLVRALGMPDKDNWYPFGLTPRWSVERLTPNHYLDLDSWDTVRHWPNGDIASGGTPENAVREVASLLKRNISAVAREREIHMALTAGRDSRMLLSCAREHLDRARFFTLRVPTAQGRLDAHLAPKIAKRFGLSHVMLPMKPPLRQQLLERQGIIGNCVGGLDLPDSAGPPGPAARVLVRTGGGLREGPVLALRGRSPGTDCRRDPP